MILLAFPHLQADDVTSRSMGAGGVDVLLSPAAQRVVPFAIECKNVQALNIWAALGQCAENAIRSGLKGLLIFKRNNTETYAVLKFDTLLKLLQNAAAGRLL